MPYNPDSGTMILGRAFLQAAIWGRNFNRQISWLGQAPGPGSAHAGAGVSYTDIPDAQTSLSGFPLSQFATSWTGYWTPLAANGVTGNNTGGGTNGGGSGLSTGAKAGIGVAVAVVALALIGLAAWLVLRRRRGSDKTSATRPLNPGEMSKGDTYLDTLSGQNHHYSGTTNTTVYEPYEVSAPHMPNKYVGTHPSTTPHEVYEAPS